MTASRWTIAAIAILTLLAVIRVASTYRVFSQTIDEPNHLAAGLQWLTNGGMDTDAEHPPLPRVLFGLGAYFEGARVTEGPAIPKGNEAFDRNHRYRHNLALARAGNLPFFLLGLAVVTAWSWRLGGRGVAIIALVLFASLPPVLAHAGLATTDMAAAATLAAALFALTLWLERPAWPRALLLGMAVGVGMASKYSFVVFFPAAAVLFVAAMRGGWGGRARQAMVAAFVAVMVVWAVFRFETGTLNELRLAIDPAGTTENVAASYARVRGYEWVRPDLIERYRGYCNSAERKGVVGIDFVDWAKATGYPSPLAGRNGDTMRGAPPIPPPGVAARLLEPFRRVGQWLALHAPLLTPTFIRGVLIVKQHSSNGQAAFLLGRYSDSGWWYYFPVILFFKTPLAFLVLALIGMALLIRRGAEAAAVALAPMAMLLPAMHSSLNIGVRHVLPLYPFLTIAAAWAAAAMWRATRPARAAVVVLLAWFLIATTVAHPDYLPYFNEAAGRHPERIATDSNLDWGQDVLRLADVVQRRRIQHLYVMLFSNGDDARHLPTPTETLPGWRPVTGWVAVSEQNVVFGPDGRGDALRWLAGYQPVERVGKSIRLYRIPPLDPLRPRS